MLFYSTSTCIQYLLFCHLNSSLNKIVERKQIKMCSTFNFHCVTHLHTLPGTKTRKDWASVLSIV